MGLNHCCSCYRKHLRSTNVSLWISWHKTDLQIQCTHRYHCKYRRFCYHDITKETTRVSKFWGEKRRPMRAKRRTRRHGEKRERPKEVMSCPLFEYCPRARYTKPMSMSKIHYELTFVHQDHISIASQWRREKEEERKIIFLIQFWMGWVWLNANASKRDVVITYELKQSSAYISYIKFL